MTTGTATADPAPAHILVLMRHGEALPASLHASHDRTRRLTPEGRRLALHRGTQLREIGAVPDLVYTSPADRTVETAHEMLSGATAQDRPVEIDPDLYEAGPEQILQTIREAPETCHTLLISGHNPSIYALACMLADRAAPPGLGTALLRGFPPAATACFHIDGNWDGLRPATARLTALFLA